MTEYNAEEYLDEKFPKGKNKLRGEAMVLLALAKRNEQERILEIIDIMRKDLNNPDYSYSNEWIENFLEGLKAKIKGEK